MNLVIIDGYLTEEPTVKDTQSGKKVCSFELSNEKGKDASGKRQYDYFKFQAWDNKADFLGNYCHKGYKMLVTGRIVNRSWETQTGEKRKVTEIVCDRIEIERGNDSAREQGNTRPSYNAPRNEQKQPSWKDELNINPDDLPFGG